jgi:RNA polymerase sigma-70 factor (ECF subfamily)
MSLRMRSDTFERLFEEHAGRLFSFLVYRTGNRALAEDLLSETFERVMRSRQRFDPRRGSERRWLYTIALNLLRDQARRCCATSARATRPSTSTPAWTRSSTAISSTGRSRRSTRMSARRSPCASAPT